MLIVIVRSLHPLASIGQIARNKQHKQCKRAGANLSNIYVWMFVLFERPQDACFHGSPTAKLSIATADYIGS